MINTLKHCVSGFLVNQRSITGDPEIDIALYRDGCYVFENYLSKQECEELILLGKDALKNKNNVKLESNSSDERIYRINEIEPKYNLKSHSDKLDSWARKFYKTKNVASFQMLGHIKFREDNLGSGGGWHRDSPFQHQFKFILYLSDVSDDNGPFQYILGTHKDLEIIKYSNTLGVENKKYRFSDDEIEKISENYTVKTVEGCAGTLLIADVKGLHRGKPLTSGERWATTRYYYNKKIPGHI